MPLTGCSNAVRRCFQYPDPLLSGEAAIGWLLDHVKDNSYDLIIPVTERILVPLSRYRDRLQHVNIAMPSADSLEVALDKSRTLSLATRLGVPCPRSVAVATLEELAHIKEELSFPVVLKPARSIGAAAGEASQLQVSYASDRSELEAGCVHALKFGAIILQ